MVTLVSDDPPNEGKLIDIIGMTIRLKWSTDGFRGILLSQNAFIDRNQIIQTIYSIVLL